MPAETFQNKYNMVFHENANCTVMNDVQFHQPVTIVSGDKTLLNETQMPSAEEGKEDVADELFAILQDKELYDETVKWAKTCKKPKDIRDRIFVPLRRKGVNDISMDLINALIPHLTNYTSSKNPSTIQKQLY